jgi:hypothetical protein
MKVRSFLPTALAAGLITVFTGCDSKNQIAGPLSSFNSFAIVVQVTDAGAGASTSGYSVTVSPGDITETVHAGEPTRISVPKNDEPYTVTLTAVAGNCSVSGSTSRSIRVRVRDRSTLSELADFTVDCP